MAEGVDNSGQLDNNNLQTSGDISSQLNVILSEIGSLKQEIHGTNITVASEVKKLKSEKDLVWRFQGNKIQFDFNSDLADIVKQSIWALENAKFDYCKEQLCEIADKVHKRNKLIRIADSSSGGWETVRQYESNPVASDSEDESKIHKAEGRALKRKRSSSRGRSSRGRDYGTLGVASGPRIWGTPAVSSQQYGFKPSVRGRLFRPQFVSAYMGSANGNGFFMPGQTVAPGLCFACGEFNHIRRNCPNIRTATVQAGDQSTGARK